MDEFIAKHLLGVSRTYALVVPMLPGPLDEAVGLAYLLMRIVDTLEDAPQLEVHQRAELLALSESALRGDGAALAAIARPLGELAAERALMVAAPEVCARLGQLDPAFHAAIVECARAMVRGVRCLIERSTTRGEPYPAVHDLGELREYCYYVAGVVGEMLCAMMAHHLGRPGFRAQRPRAIDLGTGLQLVNILKDGVKDAGQGRRYLPRAADGPEAERVYRAALEGARRSLREGIEYVLALPPSPPGLRMFCGLPMVWGGLTLARAEQDPAGAKISRAEIQDTIQRFERCAADDRALREWLGSLLASRVVTA